MSTPSPEHLNPDSRMQCRDHGIQRPTIICSHLQYGECLGFNVPDRLPAGPMAWLPMAWCDACDSVLREEGGWNDRSESFASPKMMCAACFEIIRQRNLPGDTVQKS